MTMAYTLTHGCLDTQFSEISKSLVSNKTDIAAWAHEMLLTLRTEPQRHLDEQIAGLTVIWGEKEESGCSQVPHCSQNVPLRLLQLHVAKSSLTIRSNHDRSRGSIRVSENCLDWCSWSPPAGLIDRPRDVTRGMDASLRKSSFGDVTAHRVNGKFTKVGGWRITKSAYHEASWEQSSAGEPIRAGGSTASSWITPHRCLTKQSTGNISFHDRMVRMLQHFLSAPVQPYLECTQLTSGRILALIDNLPSSRSNWWLWTWLFGRNMPFSNGSKAASPLFSAVDRKISQKSRSTIPSWSMQKVAGLELVQSQRDQSIRHRKFKIWAILVDHELSSHLWPWPRAVATPAPNYQLLESAGACRIGGFYDLHDKNNLWWQCGIKLASLRNPGSEPSIARGSNSSACPIGGFHDLGDKNHLWIMSGKCSINLPGLRTINC